MKRRSLIKAIGTDGIWKVNAELAASKGLKARPLSESIKDTWALCSPIQGTMR
jgi:hypothetical protein